MSSTAPNASRNTSRPAPRDRAAEKQRAKEQSLAQRRQRDKAWMEKRLSEVGKSEALTNVTANWQSYTPFEMSLLLNLDEVKTAAEARFMRFASVCDSARNMLIIVPIIVTWFSLALAGTAYEANLSAPKPNIKPFLQQWQEGFAPLTHVHLLWWNISLVRSDGPWFTFATFALTDATVLAVILILTIIGQTLEIRAYLRGTRIAALLERHMYTLNAGALFQGMETAPDAKTPPWLRELRTDLGHLGDVIDKMNIALDDSMERYTDAISQQKQAVSDLVTDTNKIHDSVVQLNTLFQGGVEAARVYKKYIPGITQDFANLVNTQQRSTRSMEAMADMLAKSMRYLGEMTNHVREAQDTIARYRNTGAPSAGIRAPVSQPRYRSYPSGAPSQPVNTPTSSRGGYRADNYDNDLPPAEATGRYYSADAEYGDAELTNEWAAQDEFEESQHPPRGFWRRALGHIPVVRRLVRRSR
jgi:methyl-accepting chemotaxis protein